MGAYGSPDLSPVPPRREKPKVDTYKDSRIPSGETALKVFLWAIIIVLTILVLGAIVVGFSLINKQLKP